MAATLAIGCGIALIFKQTPNQLAAPGGGWLHIKLTIVVLGVLPVHGMLRAKIKRFAAGKITSVPQWMWSLLLVSIAAILIFVERGPAMFAK